MASVVVFVIVDVSQVSPHMPCAPPCHFSPVRLCPQDISSHHVSLPQLRREVGYCLPTSLCGFQLQACTAAALKLSLCSLSLPHRSCRDLVYPPTGCQYFLYAVKRCGVTKCRCGLFPDSSVCLSRHAYRKSTQEDLCYLLKRCVASCSLFHTHKLSPMPCHAPSAASTDTKAELLDFLKCQD